MSRRLLAWLVVASALLVAIALASPVGAAQSVRQPFSAGRAWLNAPSPNNGSGVNSLTGVSCPSPRFCTAVGFYDDVQRLAQSTLIETRASAHWSVVTSPNAGTGDNNFLGVSCASVRQCVAVGFSKSNDTYQTLIESWNGTRWSIAPSPNVGTVNNILDGVSCVSATSCEAVGYDFDTNNPTGVVQSTLVESWNGMQWSIMPSPNREGDGNILYGVSCPSSTSCEAVGYAIPHQPNAPAFETLTESWNGTSWSIVPSGNKGTSASLLLGVSCVAANTCEAVGEYTNVGLGNYQTLIESWNGTSWSIVASPNRDTNSNELLGVSCTSARQCEAAGSYADADVKTQTLAETWDGTKWSLVPSANRGTDVYNVLEAVSCPQTHAKCSAVGNYLDTTLNTYRTLIESTR
jgi:hypothetical protein